MIGSSNLSSILDSQNHYEADLFVDEQNTAKEINDFIIRLSRDACVPLAGYTPKLLRAKILFLRGMRVLITVAGRITGSSFRQNNDSV
jgi:hypothetical protein